MPFLEKSELHSRFLRHGRNSSHFVWLLANLRAFEASNGWVFGFLQKGEVTLLALEPLIPEAPEVYAPAHGTAFAEAWGEFVAEVKPVITAFIGVYRPFCDLLEEQGFQWIQVGEEPWMDLADCIPQGKAGKGVRSARNQALHAGVTVEEWTAAQISAESAKRQVMQEIYAEWAGARVVALAGFMNASDPFAYMEDRRYFVLKSRDRVEAYLIATPVPGIQSYFLEDLVIRRHAPRGAGELITLEAMVALQESGAREASLGVVSMNTLGGGSEDSDPVAAQRVPKIVRFVMHTLPAAFKGIYNFNGMEVYRKRFKPQRWQSIHLCVLRAKTGRAGFGDARAWFKVLWTLLWAFQPKLQVTGRWCLRIALAPVRDYPLTFFMMLLNFGSFALVNRFGRLPEDVLARFGFTANAPLLEWPLRSVVSDFLYFDPGHFYTWGIGYCLIVHWAERKHRLSFLIPFIAAISLLDDLFNYAIIVKPFNYFQPHVFAHLVSAKDVGSSLGFSTLMGLQLHQLRRLREPLFAVGILGLVLAFAFTSTHLHLLVMNLNHALFLVVGYLTGKVLFERMRARSRKVAKGKPPVARCVRTPESRKAA